MKVPTRQQAEAYLAEAHTLNPGPWVQHSRYAGQAAAAIAAHHPHLDPDTAYVLGCLHDIGRRAGVTDMRHAIDGYDFMQAEGYPGAAQVCLTHSFPMRDVRAAFGKWDCSDKEFAFVREFLARVEYTPYDRLIQLCDALTLPSGFCLIEKRMIDVALRYGVHEYVVPKWQAVFAIQREFEQAMGRSIYSVLPGVVENTFGFDPNTPP
ncbi:MAG: HD domain-containing protein [Chloroflexi bacterium]|nr:HD domain-containing protein [Chloroflexota bacterium]MBU1746676.1 HD domain-containing protein [Chloroflexota bacterium]MBU1879340.1 HD domain-containing protein [Chloroflexota bacterium]